MLAEIENWWFRWWKCRGLSGFHARRLATIRHLGILGDERARAPLMKVLRRKQIRFSKNHSLIKELEEIVELVKAIGHLRVSDTSLSFLRNIISEHSKCKWGYKYGNRPLEFECEVSHAAIESLCDIGAVDDVIKALTNSHTLVRQTAVIYLGRKGNRNTAKHIFLRLTDPCGKVRLAAAEALVNLGESTWDSIIKGTIEDFVRLGESQDKRIFDLLINALNYNDKYSPTDCEENNSDIDLDLKGNKRRKYVIQGLGALGDQRAIEPLLISLNDYNYLREAVSALEKLGEPAWGKLLTYNNPTEGLVNHLKVDPRSILPIAAKGIRYLHYSSGMEEEIVVRILDLLKNSTLDPSILEACQKALKDYDKYVDELRESQIVHNRDYPWEKDNSILPSKSSEII